MIHGCTYEENGHENKNIFVKWKMLNVWKMKWAFEATILAKSLYMYDSSKLVGWIAKYEMYINLHLRLWTRLGEQQLGRAEIPFSFFQPSVIMDCVWSRFMNCVLIVFTG